MDSVSPHCGLWGAFVVIHREVSKPLVTRWTQVFEWMASASVSVWCGFRGSGTTIHRRTRTNHGPWALGDALGPEQAALACSWVLFGPNAPPWGSPAPRWRRPRCSGLLPGWHQRESPLAPTSARSIATRQAIPFQAAWPTRTRGAGAMGSPPLLPNTAMCSSALLTLVEAPSETLARFGWSRESVHREHEGGGTGDRALHEPDEVGTRPCWVTIAEPGQPRGDSVAEAPPTRILLVGARAAVPSTRRRAARLDVARPPTHHRPTARHRAPWDPAGVVRIGIVDGSARDCDTHQTAMVEEIARCRAPTIGGTAGETPPGSDRRCPPHPRRVHARWTTHSRRAGRRPAETRKGGDPVPSCSQLSSRGPVGHRKSMFDHREPPQPDRRYLVVGQTVGNDAWTRRGERANNVDSQAPAGRDPPCGPNG